MALKTPPTFNLLSIGHRGVGKSVFLAGSYAEVMFNQRIESKQGMWFEGTDEQSQEMLDQLLSYMRAKSRYPAPTMKIKDFTFKVVSRAPHQNETLCQFRWADVPGEICRLGNPDFKSMMLESHGCCVFIDAEALVRDPNYLASLEETIKQIEVISSLATQNKVGYLFALILTKCDQLQAGPATLAKVEQQWQSVAKRLDRTNAVYRRFKSSVSLITTNGPAVVRAQGTATPILWLVSELSEAYRSRAPKNLRVPLGSENKQTKQLTAPSPKRAHADIITKVIATVGSLAVVAGIWLGLRNMTSQSELPEIPSTKEANSASID